MPLKADVRTTAWDAADYLEDDDDIRAYLDAAFEEAEAGAICAAIGAVARARGMADIAAGTGLGRESLYKALSDTGNPTFATILKVLAALNLCLSVSEQRAVPKAPRGDMRRTALGGNATAKRAKTGSKAGGGRAAGRPIRGAQKLS